MSSTQRRRTHDAAVSEVVATILLVGFSVAIFAVVGLQVLDIPAPASTTSANLRMVLNSTDYIVISSLGGDPLSLSSLLIRLDDTDCGFTAGPGDDPDGTREDGDGVLETGERLLTDCRIGDGTLLVVVGGDGPRRAVLLKAQLPGAG